MNRRLRLHGFGLLAGLAVQYLLGMLTNLFVQFPEGASAAGQWEFARGQWLVMTHIIVGTLILIGAIALWIRAARAHDRVWKIAGGLGFGAVLLAWLSGEEFISGQNDWHSFSMALFFLAAVAAYGWGIYKSRTLPSEVK